MAPKRAAPAGKASPAKKAKAAGKASKTSAPAKKTAGTAPSADSKPASQPLKIAAGRPKLIVEHCKQCQCFKRRTAELHDLLNESLANFEWTVNPVKPRKGCFEVRDADGDRAYITLLDMPRPFKKLKELNMDAVARDIIEGKAP